MLARPGHGRVGHRFGQSLQRPIAGGRRHADEKVSVQVHRTAEHAVARCLLHGLAFAGDQLLAVDAINRPKEFMAVRRALTQGQSADPAKLADESVEIQQAFIQ